MDRKRIHISRIITLSIPIIVIFLLVHFLGMLDVDRPFYQQLINMTVFLFNIIIILTWLSFGSVAATICLFVSIIVTLLAVAISKDPFLKWHIIVFISVAVSAYYYDKRINNISGLQLAELESIEKDTNTLNEEYKHRQLQTKALQKRFSKFSILKDITESLSSSLSLAEVANLIVKNSYNIIGKADICLLFLIDEKKQKLVLSSIRKKPEFESLKIEKPDFFDKTVLNKRQPLIIQDIRKDYRFDYNMIRSRTREFRSLVSTPLLREDRSIGVIRLENLKTEVFDSEDLRILNIIANLAAVAVENAKLFKRTEELAITDSLTNCYVQRHMRQLAEVEIKNAIDSQSKISLLMIDIDYFKKYNDKYGHIAGDIVLKETSQIFMHLASPNVIVSRYGGEEFAIVLPRTDKKGAEDFAERIRRRVEERMFFLRREKTKVTISIGVATGPNGGNLNQLISEADKALYKAKRAGRNRVCVA